MMMVLPPSARERVENCREVSFGLGAEKSYGGSGAGVAIAL